MSVENPELDPKILDVIRLAIDVRKKAYCPYSNFRVGAAVLCEDGTLYAGVNVENAVHGLTVCAERLAVMKAVCEGKRKFRAIAICCDVRESFQASCGSCRQVLAEFGLNWEMYLVKPEGDWQKVEFRSLLPLAFTPASLDEDRIDS